MGDVVILSFGRKTTDGGKSRIMRRREHLYPSGLVNFDDLRMDHADPEHPCPMIDEQCRDQR